MSFNLTIRSTDKALLEKFIEQARNLYETKTDIGDIGLAQDGKHEVTLVDIPGCYIEEAEIAANNCSFEYRRLRTSFDECVRRLI